MKSQETGLLWENLGLTINWGFSEIYYQLCKGKVLLGTGAEYGDSFPWGHLQLGKDIVRGIKLKDITFTPFVRKLKGPATWPVGSVFIIQTDMALGRNTEWRRNFLIRTSFLTFNVKVSLAFLPCAATTVGQKPTEKTGENLPTRLLTSTCVSFFP